MLLGVSGCFNPFAPTLDENLSAESALISDQSDIQGVFQNFQYAYSFKDTTIYGKLLSENFTFVYRDYDIGADISWGRDEEVRVSQGMFQNTQKLDLVWNNIISITADSSNIIRSFNLTITFNPTDIIFVDGRVNIDLIKDENQKWKIVRWIDESNF